MELSETFTDMRGELVDVGDRIAMAFAKHSRGELRVGVVRSFDKHYETGLSKLVPVMEVFWEAGTSNTAVVGKSTKVFPLLQRFVVIGKN